MTLSGTSTRHDHDGGRRHVQLRRPPERRHVHGHAHPCRTRVRATVTHVHGADHQPDGRLRRPTRLQHQRAGTRPQRYGCARRHDDAVRDVERDGHDRRERHLRVPDARHRRHVHGHADQGHVRLQPAQPDVPEPPAGSGRGLLRRRSGHVHPLFRRGRVEQLLHHPVRAAQCDGPPHHGDGAFPVARSAARGRDHGQPRRPAARHRGSAAAGPHQRGVLDGHRVDAADHRGPHDDVERLRATAATPRPASAVRASSGTWPRAPRSAGSTSST